jgi:hypothetical protein
MSLIEERLEEARGRDIAKKMKDYLDKREPGLTFTARALAENLGVADDYRIVMRVSAALHQAEKHGYVKTVQREQGGSNVFRLDKQGNWAPRGSLEPKSEDEKAEKKAIVERDETVTKRVHEFLKDQPLGSLWTAIRVAERVGYITTRDVNAVSACLSWGRKKGWLASRSVDARSNAITYELLEVPPEWVVERMAGHSKDVTGAGATVQRITPDMFPELPVTQPTPVSQLEPTGLVEAPAGPPPDLQEIALQMLELASKLDGYRPPVTPLSAYTDAELADELARRMRERSA